MGSELKDCILETKGIRKYFGATKALDGVDFKIRTGEVHALIGENGAGKSTLIKVVAGVHQPTSGSIIFEGKQVNFKSSNDSQRAGISVIYQETTMFPDLSVIENIFMGHHLRKPFTRMLDWRTMKNVTKALLDKLELEINLDSKARDLSAAQRQMVEIAKALSLNSKIVIMDEPTSALTLKEVENLYKIINNLKAEGKAIVFVSHKLGEIFEISDYFTVLRDGKCVGEGKISNTHMDDIIQMMVGRSLERIFPKIEEIEENDIALKVENLTAPGVFKDISFELRKGEILGFFGLVGAGRSEVMQTILGIAPKSSGAIFLNGAKVRIRNPADAMNYGIVYIPEDRQLQGLILEMSIKENITLPIIGKISRYFFPDATKELEITDEYGKRMDIKASSWSQLVNVLSGGNQQKVSLAKWLATRPNILIMDEPTKGIDVATKAAVHNSMTELAKQGMAIIFISSELPELLGMSNNIVVMHEGTITGKFSRNEANPDNVIRAAIGKN